MSHIAYSQLQALVETEWLVAHLHDPLLRGAEKNEDVLLYGTHAATPEFSGDV